MARSKKSAEVTISEALDTSVEQTIEEAASTLGIDPFRLQELFVERLGIEEPMTWLTIPTEHESLLAEIKRSLESEASVRRFDVPPEPDAELPSIIEDEPQQSSAITESVSNELTNGINQDLEETQRLNNETIELQALLYAAEADDKAQLAASVKNHGWQIYQRVGAEIDVNTILEIAQSKLNNADGATNSRLSALASQLNVRTPEQIRTATEERKQAFLQQQQARTTAWQSATSLATSKA
jgi:hypothetical protein